LELLNQAVITKHNVNFNKVVTAFAFNMLVTVHIKDQEPCDCKRWAHKFMTINSKFELAVNLQSSKCVERAVSENLFILPDN
jgi:hypothetical protein